MVMKEHVTQWLINMFILDNNRALRHSILSVALVYYCCLVVSLDLSLYRFVSAAWTWRQCWLSCLCFLNLQLKLRPCQFRYQCGVYRPLSLIIHKQLSGSASSSSSPHLFSLLVFPFTSFFSLLLSSLSLSITPPSVLLLLLLPSSFSSSSPHSPPMGDRMNYSCEETYIHVWSNSQCLIIHI